MWKVTFQEHGLTPDNIALQLTPCVRVSDLLLSKHARTLHGDSDSIGERSHTIRGTKLTFFTLWFLTLAAGDIQTCHSPGQSVERLALDEDHHLSVQFRSAMARKVFFASSFSARSWLIMGSPARVSKATEISSPPPGPFHLECTPWTMAWLAQHA
jgi:hypothetical protein